MTFASLEQRMAQTYRDMFPKFVPDKNAGIDVCEQEKFYFLMKNLYQLAFDEPLLFVPSLHEDDAYPGRYKKSYEKPKLINDMRKFLKAMDSLLQRMYLIGQDLNVKFDKRQQEILSRIGINNYGKLPIAWTWMATRPESNNVEFMYCLFDREYPYGSDIYASLLGESSFRKLEDWMIKQGYKRFDIFNKISSDNKLTLTYANPLWSKEPPNRGFEYKIRHTGISAQYDFYVQQPAVFGLCIPNGLKNYLTAFDSMSAKNRNFVVNHTKKCNGCRYCVQTDKTGSRPLAYIQVNYEQEKYNLCPYFPGYFFSWPSINDDLVDRLIEMLSFMDKFIPISIPG
jgi:NAD-dependent dihydropyrimidine dehydrogenase PreA subunit